MTADDFLSAIAADPENPLPRLVYADWLDEQASDEACGKCLGSGSHLLEGAEMRFGTAFVERVKPMLYCSVCDGSGHVPDRNARLARGYRAMGECGISSYRVNTSGYTFADYAVNPSDRSALPGPWWLALKRFIPSSRVCDTLKGEWTSWRTRHAAENAVAIAWCELTAAEQDQCRRELAATVTR